LGHSVLTLINNTELLLSPQVGHLCLNRHGEPHLIQGNRCLRTATILAWGRVGPGTGIEL